MFTTEKHFWKVIGESSGKSKMVDKNNSIMLLFLFFGLVFYLTLGYNNSGERIKLERVLRMIRVLILNHESGEVCESLHDSMEKKLESLRKVFRMWKKEYDIHDLEVKVVFEEGEERNEAEEERIKKFIIGRVPKIQFL